MKEASLYMYTSHCNGDGVNLVVTDFILPLADEMSTGEHLASASRQVAHLLSLLA